MKRIIAVIILGLLLVGLMWFSLSTSGLRWTYKQLENYLPGELALNKLDGRLIGPINIENLTYQHNGVVIRIGQASLNWQPGNLLAANINISQLHVQSLNIVLPETEKSATVLTLPELHLPWRLTLGDAQINDITIQRGKQRFEFHTINLNASTLFSQIDIKQLEIHADQFDLTLDGELQPIANYRHALNIDWQTRLPSGEIIQGGGQLTGDMQTTHLQQQVLSPLQFSLDGEINDILGQLNWQASATIKTFELTQLNRNWPDVHGSINLRGHGDIAIANLTGAIKAEHTDTGPLNASFKLQRMSDNVVQIEQLTLNSPAHNTQLNVHGKWLLNAESGNISLAVDWKNMRWPLQGQPWFDSAIGSAWLEGNLEDYRIGMASDRPRSEAPPSFWYASADGNRKDLNIHALRIKALDGEITVTGQLSFTPELAWQATIHTDSINPESLWPEWPGQLNATLTSSGRFENRQLRGSADITQLTGQLRGYPVSLQSHLEWRDNGLDIDHLDFRSGSANITTHGRIAESLSLDWNINASDLAELYPEAGGQFKAQGQLRGTRSAPIIHATLNATALRLQDHQVEKLNTSLKIDWLHWPQFELDLAAESLVLNNQYLDSFAITGGDGRIEVKAIADTFTAQLALKGEADTQGWRGQIVQADIDGKQFKHWQLKAPVSLSINPDTVSLEPLCWHQQDSNFCLTSKRLNDKWQASIQAEKISLSLLTPWLPADLILQGHASADADIQYQDTVLLGKAKINLIAGNVSYPILEGEREEWKYESGRIDITADDLGIHASSELIISQNERFHVQLELPNASPLTIDQQQQTLRGEAQLTLYNLSLIGALIPEAQDLQGKVALNLTAAGTLAEPVLSGQAQLLNGSLRVPRLGLNIGEITMDAQSNALEKFNFNLHANSGGGTLSVTGQTVLDRIAGWPTTINIKGQDFEASHIPEAHVLVSPDLQLNLTHRTIHIAGDIHVPYAKLQPKDITTAARVSNDTVIIGDERPAEEKWSIFTRTRLTLGERVSFFGFGFEGKFGGSLLLRDEPGQLTTAIGELNVLEGRYRAYGQRLDVEHGLLLYTGGPVTNPGLDLRAVRHINEVTAGIKVWGSLKQPQLELFSNPAMGQTDALAYLMLGRPMENSSNEEGTMMAKAALALGLSGGDHLARSLGDRFGLDEMRVESNDTGEQASLVMGRYLSPRLYISYGVGLIEAFNTISVRYQISDKWQLKGESGEYQGADLLYTIER